jgi:hypothetical protein
MAELFCSGDGLKLAVQHALELMDADGTKGFDYPIGEIRGMKIRIVAEPETGCFETTVVNGEFHYDAVNG